MLSPDMKKAHETPHIGRKDKRNAKKCRDFTPEEVNEIRCAATGFEQLTLIGNALGKSFF